MNKQEVIKYCLELPNTFEDYPFSKGDIVSVVMKHNNTKTFASIQLI